MKKKVTVDQLANILIVDDNVDNLRILTAVLKEKGYKSRQVRSGARALEAVEKKHPSLILLDIQMPGMTGFEVCRHIKNNPVTNHIPVIFITAQDSLESKIEGFEIGGSDYITKPFQVEEVLARVGHQLEIQSLTKHLDRRNQQLEQILSTLPIPYVISTSNGNICDYNDRVLTLFELTAEEIHLKNAADFYMIPEERNEVIRRIQHGENIQNHEIMLKTSRNRSFCALMSASAFEFNNGTAFFVGITDITERKEMEQKLEKMAMTDPLTGLHNRRSFFDIAQRQMSLAIRQKSPISILSLDIDYFKKINDSWGHEVGDLALQHFVNVVRKNLRKSDIFSRLGGEEFAIILYGAGIDNAIESGERIRLAIENEPLKHTVPPEIPMTVSGGLSLWYQDESFDQVLARTDKAMYRAKEQGRNQIISIEPEST